MSVTFQSTTLATPPSGTTVDIGSGAAGSGTQRTILATDQPVIPVSDNGGSLTVDGTVAATQSGTWTARAQDGSGNALTSATRGSERALSVQIVDASGAQVTSFGGSGGTASNYGSAFPASGTASGFPDGTNMQGARVFDADSGAGTQYVLGANLRKIASGGSVEAGTSSDPLRIDPTGTTAQPVTQSGAWSLTANQSVNVAQINGVAATMGNGASGTGVQRVTLANDSTGILATVTNVATIGTSVTPGTAATNLGKAEDAAHTSGDVGVLSLAVRQDTLANSTSADGDYGALKLTTAGRLYASATIDAALPTGTAALGTVTLDDVGTGWTVSAINSAASTNATSAKGSAGRLHGWAVYNSNASPRYLKLYNKASSPTVGSDTPFMRVLIPAGGGANVAFPSPGITMGTGVAYALTTGAADSDTGAVASNEIQCNVYYS